MKINCTQSISELITKPHQRAINFLYLTHSWYPALVLRSAYSNARHHSEMGHSTYPTTAYSHSCVFSQSDRLEIAYFIDQGKPKETPLN